MQNCYNVNGIPPELLGEQNERLSSKHIHTLKFLQEIVNENKALKAKVEELEEKLSRCEELHAFAENSKERIKEIQEQYLARADEINAMLLEKHQLEIMQKVNDNLEAEQNWSEERKKLLEQIERLKTENSKLQESLRSSKDQRDHIEILQLKVNSLQQEIERLTEAKTSLEEASENQLVEIKRLQKAEDKSKQVADKVKELQQKNKELQLQISKMAREMTDTGAAEQEAALNALKNKFGKLLKEMAALVERENSYKTTIETLQEALARCRQDLADSEQRRDDLRAQLELALQKVSVCQRMSSADRDRQTFKDFVTLKRDMVVLKEENAELKLRLKMVKSSTSLPALRVDASKVVLTGERTHTLDYLPRPPSTRRNFNQ